MKLFSAGLAVLLAASSVSAVEMPAFFSDNMVLQREAQVPLWGTGTPGEVVQVEFQNQKLSALVDDSGNWSVLLKPMPADRNPGVLKVAGKNTLTFSNVLVGDVWLCAGQSNMQFELRRVTGGAAFVAKADQPEIRLLQIPRVWSRTPQRNVKAAWAVCSPKTVGRFSAVAYLVARDLAARLNVPIGVIDISWGGCRIEAMTTRQAFRKASVNDEVAAAAEQEFVKLDKTADPDLRKDKQRLPGVLYNAMVHPLTPMAVRGMLWYQGEDNHSESMRYAEKLKALAYAWRQAFCKEDLPIFIVQLPPWQYGNEDPVRIPKFWEAQQYFAEHDRNAGFIVATDCGDPADIHPKDKAPLAARLANLVLFKEYGLGDDSVLAPVFRQARRVNGAVEVEFDHANGLKTRDGKGVSHLMLAGADGKFHPATGEIRSDRLIVRSPEVPEPEQIRFGWDKLANPNLVNRAGVPAAPFEKRIP